MAVNIPLPNITGGDAESSVQQMRSYLYQLAQQLNWAFNTLDTMGIQAEGEESGEQVEMSLRSLLNKGFNELDQEVKGLSNRINQNMDLRTDGKGVTFGGKAEQEGFRCNMAAEFSGGMTINGIPLDDYIRNITGG